MRVTLVNIHNFSTILTKEKVLYVERNIMVPSRNHYYRGQAIQQYILHILTVCFVAFVISMQDPGAVLYCYL